MPKQLWDPPGKKWLQQILTTVIIKLTSRSLTVRRELPVDLLDMIPFSNLLWLQRRIRIHRIPICGEAQRQSERSWSHLKTESCWTVSAPAAGSAESGLSPMIHSWSLRCWSEFLVLRSLLSQCCCSDLNHFLTGFQASIGWGDKEVTFSRTIRDYTLWLESQHRMRKAQHGSQ